jgi:hypothetical protein
MSRFYNKDNEINEIYILCPKTCMDVASRGRVPLGSRRLVSHGSLLLDANWRFVAVQQLLCLSALVTSVQDTGALLVFAVP